jgi:hypothetical protein
MLFNISDFIPYYYRMVTDELQTMWKWSWYNLILACYPCLFLEELRKTMKNSI